MKTNGSGVRAQNEATKRQEQRDETGGSKLSYHEKPEYTSARDLGPVLRHPKPSWDRKTLAKIPQRMEFELSEESEAGHQSGANKNTSLQQRSPSEPKATSTLAPPRKRNNHKIPSKPTSPKPIIASNVLDLSQVDYDKVLVANAFLSSQPPPKSATPSQSTSKHEVQISQRIAQVIIEPKIM